jgi:hypothetical protein
VVKWTGKTEVKGQIILYRYDSDKQLRTSTLFQQQAGGASIGKVQKRKERPVQNVVVEMLISSEKSAEISLGPVYICCC